MLCLFVLLLANQLYNVALAAVYAERRCERQNVIFAGVGAIAFARPSGLERLRLCPIAACLRGGSALHPSGRISQGVACVWGISPLQNKILIESNP